MDMVGLEYQNFSMKDHDEIIGQTMVEYLLLLVVIMTLVGAFFRSRLFTDYFGENGSFSKVYQERMEYGYRHGMWGTKTTTINPLSKTHETYSPGGGESRFFGPKEKYP